MHWEELPKVIHNENVIREYPRTESKTDHEVVKAGSMDYPAYSFDNCLVLESLGV